MPAFDAESRNEYILLGAVIAGMVAVNYLLPIDRFTSTLLVGGAVLVGASVLVPGAWRTLYRKAGIGRTAWLIAIGVAGGGIAHSYVTGDPQPFCDGLNPYRGCLSAFGWASTVFIGSCLAVAIAVGHLGRYRRIRNAVATPAAEVEEGMVAVEGRIVPAGSTFDGPVSGRETVWYRRATETTTVFRGYREIDHDTVGSEFYVEDGSGRLLVLPQRLDIHDVADLATSHTTADGDVRRREWSFHPNDAVTVVGFASEVSRAEYPEPVVVGLEGPVLVGGRTLAALRRWAARRAVLGGAIATVVGGLSLLVMVLTA